MIRDVVVVGGGSTGLMLACELRLAGVSVTVLERLAEPAEFSTVVALGGRALDLLDHCGLLERLSDHSASLNLAQLQVGQAPLDLRRLNRGQPKTLLIQQARIEELLEERAHELGATLRWGHQLTCVQPEQDSLMLDIRDPNGDYRLRTRYLVGCDSLDQIVRELVHGAGSTSALHPCSELYELRERAGEHSNHSHHSVPSTWTLKQPWRLRYRAGRILLAGDAAHIDMPAGGPGLNIGLQDAANLGWKLAAEVRGWAPPGLLDTYDVERHVDHLLQETDICYPMDAEGMWSHPLVGRWAPDIGLLCAQGRRMPQLMRRARGVLLDLAGYAALGDITAGWADRVDLVAARCEQPAPAAALLIRPDGYVAWAAGRLDREALCGLRRALDSWFGAACDGCDG
jgi:3-(3-hydroxy-phenyl)propionate hydroxylase